MDHVPPAAPGTGGHTPLPLLMHPCPRALVVSGDAGRLQAMETGLRQEGYKEVETYTDPTMAMAMRRGVYHLVMVDMFPLRAGAFELLECAISEMNAEAHALSKVGDRYENLTMRDLETLTQAIKFNKYTSSEGTPNHGNNSPVSTVSTTTTIGSSSGRRAPSRKIIRLDEMKSHDVEQDREHTEDQRQQLTHKSKKDRLVWTEELHNKFVDAYNKLLPGDRVPKKILRLMNDTRLTRENVASHLQVPSMMMQASTTTSVYMNRMPNHETMITASSKSETDNKRMDVVVSEKITVSAKSNTDNEQMNVVVPEKMYSGPQVEMEHQIVCNLDISDGSFQEDFNDNTQQKWSMDLGSLEWESELNFYTSDQKD